MDKIDTNGKMKKAGYICIGIALLLTILKGFGIMEDPETIDLIKYWGGLGFSLLIGNSAKHAIGSKLLQNSPKGIQ
ncbi:MAG: hypothetical protein WBA74_10245 [Cyclobacteriaceae bacterium]